jgi:8-amino-7-oxononanoate synthase
LIDGIRLSGAKARVFEHLNLDALELQLQQRPPARARWIVCESYYSMDGDGPDLGRLDQLAKQYDAQLYVDEAHAVGIFGPQGRGLCAAAGIVPDVSMVAFGKSFGAQGACILGSAPVRTWLWNRARSFVFSTAPSPLLAQSIRGQLLRVQAAETERAHLSEMALLFREKLQASGLTLEQNTFGPIVSLVLKSADAALAAARALRNEGILAQAIRPPTVPNGQSRLRLVLRVAMGEVQIHALAAAVIRAQAASLSNSN